MLLSTEIVMSMSWSCFLDSGSFPVDPTVPATLGSLKGPHDTRSSAVGTRIDTVLALFAVYSSTSEVCSDCPNKSLEAGM